MTRSMPDVAGGPNCKKEAAGEGRRCAPLPNGDDLRCGGGSEGGKDAHIDQNGGVSAGPASTGQHGTDAKMQLLVEDGPASPRTWNHMESHGITWNACSIAVCEAILEGP